MPRAGPRDRPQSLQDDAHPFEKRSHSGDFGRDILLNNPFDSPLFIEGYSLKATIGVLLSPPFENVKESNDGGIAAQGLHLVGVFDAIEQTARTLIVTPVG